MVYLPVCQSGLSVIQGKNHSTGGWHSLSGSLVIRRRGGCRSASRLVPFTAFGGQSFSASWATSPGMHCTQAVTQQAPQVIQGLTRRATRVCFGRDTSWVKLAFQASFRCAVLRSMLGCCRACISRARFLSSWQAWIPAVRHRPSGH